jgi:hypothetical protein
MRKEASLQIAAPFIISICLPRTYQGHSTFMTIVIVQHPSAAVLHLGRSMETLYEDNENRKE